MIRLCRLFAQPIAALVLSGTLGLLAATTQAAAGGAASAPGSKPAAPPKAQPAASAAPTGERATAPAAAPATAALPPAGWWVPATLKLPKAAEGRLAWRFTPKEIITVDKDNKLERRPAELRALSATSFKSDAPVAMQIDLDERQNIVTVTILKPKVAFFTLNPAGEADTKRFDSLVIDVHAEPAEVKEVCDKASRCSRFAELPHLAPPDDQRSLTTCQSALATIRQELAAARRAIPTICR
ncbi:MAG: hypothetical protein JNJ46_02225 [Myxococcales bacterium]|nr:hypothetical protein [Myxococcales bacterium]